MPDTGNDMAPLPAADVADARDDNELMDTDDLRDTDDADDLSGCPEGSSNGRMLGTIPSPADGAE